MKAKHDKIFGVSEPEIPKAKEEKKKSSGLKKVIVTDPEESRPAPKKEEAKQPAPQPARPAAYDNPMYT